MLSSAVVHRRALHRIPELDDQLPETTAYVRTVLEGLPCQVSAPIPGSVCAFFDAGKPETVAFRADLDALPVSECTGLPWASVHPGKMHACGHDGHTAMMLALAEFVGAHLDALPRNVLFLFQPAEETTGGALRLCQSGILSRHGASRVFGLHLWPGLPAGQVYTRPGAMMARANEVTVTITGKSVHLSRAAEGLDALTAGAEYLRRAYAMTDTLPPEELVVLRFGKMVSGTVRNAVSGKPCWRGACGPTGRRPSACAGTSCAPLVRTLPGRPAAARRSISTKDIRPCGTTRTSMLPSVPDWAATLPSCWKRRFWQRRTSPSTSRKFPEYSSSWE